MLTQQNPRKVDMPTYTYICEKSDNHDSHGEFEEFHSINDKLEVCPICVKEGVNPPNKVTRLISGGTSFILSGGGWADTGYSSK